MIKIWCNGSKRKDGVGRYFTEEEVKKFRVYEIIDLPGDKNKPPSGKYFYVLNGFGNPSSHKVTTALKFHNLADVDHPDKPFMKLCKLRLARKHEKNH